MDTHHKATPVVSVVVPTFNDEAMLVQALESLQRQTFRDFEVIVGDDASSNRTVDLARDFCRQDSRFRVEAFSTNVGMTRNWNRTVACAAGKYVCKLDGDDCYQPRMLEALYSELEDSGNRIAFCRTLDCDESLAPQSSYYGERAFILNGVEPSQDHRLRGKRWYQLCFDGYQLWHSNAFLIDRQLLGSLSGWDTRWGCAADTDIILRMLELDEGVSSISYAGVLYRRRAGSVLDTYSKRHWRKLETNAVLLLSLQRGSRSGLLTQRAKLRWASIWRDQQREKDRVASLEEEFGELPACEIEYEVPSGFYRALTRVRSGLSRYKRALVRQLT